MYDSIKAAIIAKMNMNFPDSTINMMMDQLKKAGKIDPNQIAKINDNIEAKKNIIKETISKIPNDKLEDMFSSKILGSLGISMKDIKGKSI